MKRSELRRLIMEELKGVAEGGFFSGGFSGGNHADHAPTTRQVMDQMSGDAESEINDAMEDEMSTEHGFRNSQDVRPLETGELKALMMASMNPKIKEYKLDMERLAILNSGNLTDKERELIRQAV